MFKLFKKKESEERFDQSEKDQLDEFRRNPMLASMQLLPAGDTVEGGYGTFGAITNPIPVNGPAGEVIYLNRLRSASGVGFFFHRPGSRHFNNAEYPLDGLELLAVDGSMRATLWFSMYHPRRSCLAPEGMTLMPFPRDKTEQLIVRAPGMGVTARVVPFPRGLPAVVKRSLDRDIPGFGDAMAHKVGELLSSIDIVAEPRWADGPLEVVLQPQEGGTFAFILDAAPAQVDSCRLPLEMTFAEVQEHAEAEAKVGVQALLPFAVLDMQSLTPDEKQVVRRAIGSDGDGEGQFELYFLLFWLSHELQGRPLEDGGFGKRVDALCLCHWADLPEMPELNRDVRRVLNAVAGRRAWSPHLGDLSRTPYSVPMDIRDALKGQYHAAYRMLRECVEV